MSIPTERNPAVPWFLDWFSASVKQGERTLAEHDLGERWTELLMFVSAVRNARRSAGAVLGENHPLVSGFDAACVDLKNLRDMLEHHEEYIFGQGKLQKPRKEAQLPHRFNLMISGGNGSHALSILVQTSDEADSEE